MVERWALGLLLASIALLPFGRAAELPMAMAAAGGLVQWLRGHGGGQPGDTRLLLIVFAGYWLPELLSAVDSVDPARSWGEVVVDLRYLPMLGFFAHGLASAARQQQALIGIAALVSLWLLDALVQAASGWSLGGAFTADRLSGIFGAEDLKLGPVVAVLAPFLLLAAKVRGRVALLVALAALLTVVLLAGTRAAWIMLLVGLLSLALPRLGWHRSVAMLVAVVVVAGLFASVAYRWSQPFAARIDRSAAALHGDRDAIDYALAGRFPIWRTAWAMTLDHPVNGIGVRAFRHAYPDFAAADDPWVGFIGNGDGAAHAHQIALELLSETGVLGVLSWLAAAVYAGWRQQQGAAEQRRRGEAAGIALLVMLFPLNTHYAFYSSAWGGLLMVLLALWLAALREFSANHLRD